MHTPPNTRRTVLAAMLALGLAPAGDAFQLLGQPPDLGAKIGDVALELRAALLQIGVLPFQPLGLGAHGHSSPDTRHRAFQRPPAMRLISSTIRS